MLIFPPPPAAFDDDPHENGVSEWLVEKVRAAEAAAHADAETTQRIGRLLDPTRIAGKKRKGAPPSQGRPPAPHLEEIDDSDPA